MLRFPGDLAGGRHNAAVSSAMTAVRASCFMSGLDDYWTKFNLVRPIDVFVDELDLAGLADLGVEAEATGRPAYIWRHC
jgi:hypothetical protein